MGRFFNEKIKNLPRLPSSKTMEEMRKKENRLTKLPPLEKAQKGSS